MNVTRALRSALFFSVFLSGACQTGLASEPAVLASGDAETMAKVKAALSESLGRAMIEFGAGDPTETPSLSVLPPPSGPYEDRSLARPAMFDLILQGDVCYAVSRETGGKTELKGVACRP